MRALVAPADITAGSAPVAAGGGSSASAPHADHRHVIAQAHLAVDSAGGRSRVRECWGEPPLVPRQTPEGISWVGGSAGPMGGDHFTTTVHVGDGASLSVGSVAATYARPGADGETSTAGVAAHVGSAGRLRWAPEPLVAVVGCRHRTETTIELGDGARLFWVDVTVLGRHGEDGGEVRSRRSVDLSGRPLNRQELSMGGADRRAHDPAVLGGARVVASCLVVHPEWERTDRDHPVTGPAPGEAARDTLTEVSPLARAGVLRLAGPGVEILGLGTTLASVLDTWAVLAERLSVLAPDTAQALTGYVEGSR